MERGKPPKQKRPGNKKHPKILEWEGILVQLKNNRLLVGIILLAFVAGIAFTGGIIFATGGHLANPKMAAFGLPQQASELPGVGPNTIADIVDKKGPAVVKIETMVTTTVQRNPFFNDPFFRDFFGDQFGRPMSRVQKGLGSGFIVSSDGYILTNEHVIEGAQDIQVTLVGRSKPVPARVVGSDRELDLAVLKINAGTDLPTLKLGNSDQIAVGNWVIAIGNPYGLDHTVTVGVISAKGRPITVEDRSYRNLLQTDASINPGNSGGPLINLQGEVIGINTAVDANAQGIGFAIPSNTVKGVLEELMGKGKISRGWLGIEMQEVTPGIASYLGYSGTGGVVVRDVVSGSPAARAGLRQGDIITAMNGSRIGGTDDMLNRIEKTKPGTRVELAVWRDGNTIKISVTLGERP